jgi:Fe-S oxidoreductase
VDFSAFVRNMRALARAQGRTGPITHGDVVHTWSKMMVDPDLEQNRLGWLERDLKISDNSDTIYFTGCLPYYEVFFSYLGAQGVTIARDAVRIMNAAGVIPHLMGNERCCGHDQLWQGDVKTFGRLARRNAEAFKAAGAGRIVTTCPECAYTLKYDYPRWGADHGMKVRHFSQFLLELIQQGRLDFAEPSRKTVLTFQDPCRLGRFMGEYEAPRTVLRQAGFELVEMPKTRETSLCCGTSCWTACGQVNKQIQTARLTQAKSTGAQILATACIKCQIHFKCAQKDLALQDDIAIPICDLTTLVAQGLTRAKD